MSKWFDFAGKPYKNIVLSQVRLATGTSRRLSLAKQIKKGPLKKEVRFEECLGGISWGHLGVFGKVLKVKGTL